MLRRIEDWLLKYLQRRCEHPGSMVALDVLEGSANSVAVGYCRRCGAYRLQMFYSNRWGEWRMPDPDLWRGK